MVQSRRPSSELPLPAAFWSPGFTVVLRPSVEPAVESTGFEPPVARPSGFRLVAPAAGGDCVVVPPLWASAGPPRASSAASAAKEVVFAKLV